MSKFNRNELCRLLFEISSEDRLETLTQLDQEPMKISTLSQKLGFTVQECSRDISRLENVELVERELDGLYHLTSSGKLVLGQLQGFNLISHYKDYFNSHSVVNLPQEFIYRIGELSDSNLVRDMVVTLDNIERLIREAEEYIYTISDQYSMNILFLLEQAFSRKVKIRNLEAMDWVAPEEQRNIILSNEQHIEIPRQARLEGFLEEKFLKPFDVYLYISEKEVAILAFPLKNGKFDYLGFSSRNKKTHKWCKDLFEYYWVKGINRRVCAEELYNQLCNKPDILNILEQLRLGEKIKNHELESELENMCLIKQGKITELGRLVCSRYKRPSDFLRFS